MTARSDADHLNPVSDVDVLVVGDYFIDLILAGVPTWPTPGGEVFADTFATVPGGTYTQALALHRLGTTVQWVTEFGTDAHSAQVLAAALAEGLDTARFVHHPGPVRNLSVAVSHAGDRGFVSYREPRPPLPVAPVVSAVAPRVLLLAELLPADRAQPVLDAAAAVGAQVVMDCQHTDLTLDAPGIVDTLSRIDVFLPNAVEAQALTGLRDLDAAARRLAQYTPTVVVKDGPRGALAVTESTTTHVDAPQVAVVDTTGAGDCFDAGFVHARLRGLDLVSSVRVATACGALATTGYGGVAAPTLDQVTAVLPNLLTSAETT